MQKTKQALDNVLHWVLASSANPSAASLTVRGLLVSAVPTIMLIAGFAHINLGSDTLTSLFDSIATLVQDVLTVVGAAMTTWGILRKIVLTLKTAPSVPTGGFQG